MSVEQPREKTGVSWCLDHERYETLFADPPPVNPHTEDWNPEGPTPDPRAYLTPSAPERREWVQ